MHVLHLHEPRMGLRRERLSEHHLLADRRALRPRASELALVRHFLWFVQLLRCRFVAARLLVSRRRARLAHRGLDTRRIRRTRVSYRLRGVPGLRAVRATALFVRRERLLRRAEPLITRAVAKSASQ